MDDSWRTLTSYIVSITIDNKWSNIYSSLMFFCSTHNLHFQYLQQTKRLINNKKHVLSPVKNRVKHNGMLCLLQNAKRSVWVTLVLRPRGPWNLHRLMIQTVWTREMFNFPEYLSECADSYLFITDLVIEWIIMRVFWH